jgi:predicted aspartyl protease
MPTFSDTISNLHEIGPVFDVTIAVPEDLSRRLVADKMAVPSPVKVSAMIDTGADSSVVTPEIMKSLGISPIDWIPIITAGLKEQTCPLFCARIIFSNGVSIESSEIIGASLHNPSLQCLLGRDVLKSCLFIYNGQDEIVTLSF